MGVAGGWGGELCVLLPTCPSCVVSSEGGMQGSTERHEDSSLPTAIKESNVEYQVPTTHHLHPTSSHADPSPSHADPSPSHADPSPSHADPSPSYADPSYTDPFSSHTDPSPSRLLLPLPQFHRAVLFKRLTAVSSFGVLVQ